MFQPAYCSRIVNKKSFSLLISCFLFLSFLAPSFSLCFYSSQRLWTLTWKSRSPLSRVRCPAFSGRKLRVEWFICTRNRRNSISSVSVRRCVSSLTAGLLWHTLSARRLGTKYLHGVQAIDFAWEHVARFGGYWSGEQMEDLVRLEALRELTPLSVESTQPDRASRVGHLWLLLKPLTLSWQQVLVGSTILWRFERLVTGASLFWCIVMKLSLFSPPDTHPANSPHYNLDILSPLYPSQGGCSLPALCFGNGEFCWLDCWDSCSFFVSNSNLDS